MRESLAVDVLSGSGRASLSDESEALEWLGFMVPAACPAACVRLSGSTQQ